MTAEAVHSTEPLDDLEEVRHKLEQLAGEGRVDELIELVLELLVRVRADNNKLVQQLKSALRMLYGTRRRRGSPVTSSRVRRTKRCSFRSRATTRRR